MENFISKELLEDVLSDKIIDYSIHTGFIFLNYENTATNINIYELAYKLESHFMLLGFQIKSWFNEIDSFIEIYYLDDLVFEQQYQCPKVEAIFKACEHIRKELLK